MSRVARGVFGVRARAALLCAMVLFALSVGVSPAAGTIHAAAGAGGSATALLTPGTQTANTGDCNHNGIPDAQEASWANRDDDGDGLCNGIDYCPYEYSVSNTAAPCTMQAITVPADPADLKLPHATYSGAIITLKGIARYGGNQYMWDFGDGTSPTAWMNISDPFNLGLTHVYTGSPGQRFTATLSVRDGSAPAVVASAAYPVAIQSGSDLGDPAQVDVRTQMAVDAALWYLHTTMLRSQYSDGPLGYYQRYGYWDSGNLPSTCTALDALELQGSTAESNWRSDPYAEDARRALNYVLVNTQSMAIGPQHYQSGLVGNPDTNGNGIGLAVGGDSTAVNGVCARALADDATPTGTAQTGPSNVYGRPLHDVVQDTVDWLSFSQVDVGYGEGGWGYSANSTGWTSNDLNFWSALAMGAAQSRMGAIVPAFVRSELPRYLSLTHHVAQDAFYGGWGLHSSTDGFVDAGRTGDGLALQSFLGAPSTDSVSVQPGVGFLFRHWNDVTTSSCWDTHLGWTGTMYRVMSGLVGLGLSRVTDWDYTTNQQTGNSFDWYYPPVWFGRQGYATYLIPRQFANGSWSDTSPCGISGDEAFTPTAVLTTAFVTAILLRSGVPLVPVAPAGPTATLSSGTVTVNWSPPASAGSPITTYSVTCTDTTAGTTGCPTGTISVDAPTNLAQISGLTAGHTYTFSVNATNAAGTGPTSPPSNPVTIASPTAAQVRAFHVQRTSSGLVFAWTLARPSGVVGFIPYAAHRPLTSRPIGLHPSHAYRYRTHTTAAGPYALHVLLANGSQVTLQPR